MTPRQEEDVLERSVALIEKLTGRRPRGYVAPWWEMSAVTAELLLRHGFSYDHSQGYRDFVPFYARVGDRWDRCLARQSRTVAASATSKICRT